MVTGSYALAHFAVDLACAFCVFSAGRAGPDVFLLYNFFAFAMQMPIGLLADRVNKNKLFALSGMALVGICLWLPRFSLPIACLLGLGNALFHIGGGLDVLNIANSKAAPLGIFVSPGAFGIYLGALAGKSGHGTAIVFLTLFFAGVLVSVFCRQSRIPGNPPLQLPEQAAIQSAFCLFLVVVLRSLAGSCITFSWKTGAWVSASVCATVLGKALGGVAADRFGIKFTSVRSLALATVLYLFADFPIPGLAAILLFNMTMPITLHLLCMKMRNAKGFAFGLLTFALFLGFLPAYFGFVSQSVFVLAIIGAGSLVLMIGGWKEGGA